MGREHGKPLRALCTVKLKDADRIARRPRDLSYAAKQRGPSWDRAQGRER